MGGTGSKQEDQIITVAIEKATGAKFTYIPFKGGGDVAVQLVGKHIDSTVNNPIEAVAQWRAGKLRPLCVFDDKRMPYKTKVTDTMSWNDIPTCKEAGVAVDYLMLRGIFMPAGVTKEQVDFYVDLFKKVRETPDWKKFMEDGAFNTTVHDRRRIREVGRGRREDARRPDEGSRLPGQAVTGNGAQRSKGEGDDESASRRTQRQADFDARDGDRRRAGRCSRSARSSWSTATGWARAGATTARSRATSRSTSGS